MNMLLIPWPPPVSNSNLCVFAAWREVLLVTPWRAILRCLAFRPYPVPQFPAFARDRGFSGVWLSAGDGDVGVSYPS
jgi:hypothetical protein